MSNYLDNLYKKKNVTALAPMADVTDFVFREMIEKYSGGSNNKSGGPDIFWTEFVSADGLCHKEGRKKLLIDLKFSRQEKPILAQIFGSQRGNITEAIKIIYKLGFDGVDVNMGCPDRNIEKQNSGASLIKNRVLAKDILESASDTIKVLNQENKKFFSFSVKTRIGYNKIEYQDWFPVILNFEPDILTVHLRTRKEMSLVEAHWELSKEIVDFIRKYCIDNNLKIPFIILNGDVKNILEVKEKIKLSGANGIMIGRGVFGTPWVFNEKEYNKRKIVDLNTKKGKENILFRLKVCLEHTKNFEKYLVKEKSFNLMKKHYKAYINGFDNAKELRTEMMNAKDYKEVKKIVDRFIKEKIK